MGLRVAGRGLPRPWRFVRLRHCEKATAHRGTPRDLAAPTRDSWRIVLGAERSLDHGFDLRCVR